VAVAKKKKQHQKPESAAATLEELESDPKYIIVRIDQYDTFHVSAAAWEAEQEAPSKPDLLHRLRQARAGGAPSPTHMLVLASEEATNGQVVAALDAGAGAGMEDVKLMTIPAEE
jgi:biopolymer transport protein ExbD